MVLRSLLIKVPSPPDKDDLLGRSDAKCEATVCASVYSLSISSLFCVSLLSKNSLTAAGTSANLIMVFFKYAAVRCDFHVFLRMLTCRGPD